MHVPQGGLGDLHSRPPSGGGQRRRKIRYLQGAEILDESDEDNGEEPPGAGAVPKQVELILEAGEDAGEHVRGRNEERIEIQQDYSSLL